MPVVPHRSEVIPAQRRNLILDLIRKKGVISVHELAETIGVSLPTIRRDLNWLARTGTIQRSHGGASLNSPPGTTFEPDAHTSATLAQKEKAAIARLAAQRLKAQQSVLFDSSSTVYEVARQVAKSKIKLTAVTNDIRIAELLAAAPAVHLVVSGGACRPGSYTLLGEPGLSFLQSLHVDVAVMGIHAVHDSAFCDTSLEVAYAKRRMAAAAKQVIVVADGSKFGQVAFFDAFEVGPKFEVITDRPLAPDICGSLEKTGARVTHVGEQT
jgi:DeoR family transcriptional regulator of aga operon